MPSGIRETTANHFEAYYEHPWGGVHSSADAADIPPNSLVIQDGAIVKSGRLCSTGFDVSTYYAFNNVGSNTQQYFDTALVTQMFTIGNQTIALDINGNAWKNVVGVDNHFHLDQTLSPPPVALDCVQIIAGVAYIFDYAASSMYVYIPTVSYTVGTNFVGGRYCCVVDQYLITANTNQASDTPARKPDRYNWSGPGKYTTWDPSIDRTAGFNTLADVSDEITGCFAMGNVGYILRNQGLSQLTPTGIGVAPFQTSTLYGGYAGIGCTYPKTFAQYGYIAIWANDNGIYVFTGGSAPQEIAGTAKEAIFNDINQYEDNQNFRVMISGAIINGSDNNKRPQLMYNLVILQDGLIGGAISIQTITWSYNINQQVWSRTVTNINQKLNQIIPGTITQQLIQYCVSQGTFVARANNSFLNQTGFSVRKFYGSMLLAFELQINGVLHAVSILLFQYINDTGQNTNQPNLITPLNLTFKQEEIKLGRQPNIRMVAIKTAGFGVLSVQVNNQVFTQIMVANSTPATYLSSGMFTGENPQLTITSPNYDGFIVKAMMPGTFADGDLG